ncbi:MAG TPA: hypothetical protein VK928_00245, partial [Longimicrobiales bacterium]|nr:hypothetical protein [Longimicrobiales bacterium]
MKMRWLTLLTPLALAACEGDAAPAEDADTPVTMEAMQPALATITAEDILRRTAALAHDSMEGRSPGGAGEER